MKLLFLSKRRPQGRDLFTRPYGRFFNHPRLLAESGHTVCLFVLSYANDPPLQVERDGITWLSESLRPSGPTRYLRTAVETVKAFRPDWIVGYSDIYFGIMAGSLSRKFGTGSAIDAYDNYESYMPWLTPLRWLWRRAVRQADVVTAAGPQLASLLERDRPGRPVHVVPMAADPSFHASLDRHACRERLGLPLNVPMVGYCGAVHRNRGIAVLFDAFEEIRHENREVRLVVSGRKERGVRLPPFVKWMGYLPDDHMPYLLNAMNVLVVINRLSAFGKFSYPAKLYEAMACGLPVVATATAPAAWILGSDQRSLARPGDPHDLARKISALLPQGRMDYSKASDWTASARLFESALLR